MEKNYAKYRAYALAYTMINNALEHRCPLQAITIEESILSDRLWSTLNVGLQKRKLGTLGQALREWKPKGAGVRNQNVARFDAEMELLFPRIEKWWNCRNDLLHGIAKSWQGEGPLVDASDFQSKAMSVAKEGLTLANKVKSWTQKQIRLCLKRRRHERCED